MNPVHPPSTTANLGVCVGCPSDTSGGNREEDLVARLRKFTTTSTEHASPDVPPVSKSPSGNLAKVDRHAIEAKSSEIAETVRQMVCRFMTDQSLVGCAATAPVLACSIETTAVEPEEVAVAKPAVVAARWSPQVAILPAVSLILGEARHLLLGHLIRAAKPVAQWTEAFVLFSRSSGISERAVPYHTVQDHVDGYAILAWDNSAAEQPTVKMLLGYLSVMDTESKPAPARRRLLIIEIDTWGPCMMTKGLAYLLKNSKRMNLDVYLLLGEDLVEMPIELYDRLYLPKRSQSPLGAYGWPVSADILGDLLDSDLVLNHGYVLLDRNNSKPCILNPWRASTPL
ncbi:uncharacterized protein ACA1_363240 [Acanthamoeba castellanii str. Neff]|uniref:Uncharacterized protein n=1 Tax=Acanthamoeba castellanii (strain ATCC 30010 / Neff) TaxID=1257118 RepID=L8GFG1_ACACF|nr:uncharacterized protein ACA1_363240 [Acanthamoeba castellanii str. Neff]ELR11825.1 hypothetical protein ACA1_363240 [Acanthamoeba castellanii str. Neff]